MTIREFQSDPEKIAGLRAALANPFLVEAMAILARVGPGIIRSDITPTFAAVKLGRIAGFSEYADMLEGMTVMPRDDSDIANERLKDPDDEEEETPEE